MLDPDIGNRYWTHRASMEAETYEPSGACPVPPWAGVITRSNPPILASVGPEYPDGDTDPNASAYVRTGDLYDTEDAAFIGYVVALRAYLADRVSEMIDDALDGLETYLKIREEARKTETGRDRP